VIHRTLALALLPALLAAAPAAAAPTRSSPIAVAPAGASGDVVFVVNPDSDSVARIEFDAMHLGTLTHEAKVGKYPRTLALAGSFVFTADQNGSTVSRLNQTDLGGATSVDLGAGCNPFGVAPTPDGNLVLATCQGTSELVVLDPGSLGVTARIKLPWPNARAIAVSSDGAKAYVTHYLTEEPGTDAHVSVVDVRNRSVATVFAVAADRTTCETQNSGQGVINLVSAIALVPDGAPADVAGQLWIGGTQENNIDKGLFKRFPMFADEPGAALFPLATFAPFPVVQGTGRGRKRKPPPFPNASSSRNKYKASFHDITRFGIFKLDAADGHVVGKLDIDEANNATDIEFSADGATAYVVDVMFNSYHVFNAKKGQGSDVTTLFAAPSSFGPGGADPTMACIANALQSVTAEGPFRMSPQAQITVIDGYNPIDPALTVVSTGVEFDTKTFQASGVSQMRPAPDGIGTGPIGVRLSADGTVAYVANYLSRNVVPAASAAPLDGSHPANLRCASVPTQACGTNNDCPRGAGFCNHPGGGACTTDGDCGAMGPCINSADCVPLILGPPVSSLAGGIVADPVPPGVLDGKILFNTAGRDSSVPNAVGLGKAAPLFNDANTADNAKAPGSVVSVSHDASYVTCSTCHADFGGQDGRTWDFSQFGASLRNTMDLRGRPGFAPGHCSNSPGTECFFDAACGDGNYCQMRDDLIPPNVPAADRARYFNPMLTVHWNGDRDEVEDFEHTYRSLMGAGDCDGTEDIVRGICSNDPGVQCDADLDCGAGNTCKFNGACLGALIQRTGATSDDPADVNADLGPPNRNIPGKTHPNVGVRLTHMADFVYSLTTFVQNPNPTSEAAERGRRLFNDSQTRCAECHNSLGTVGKQFFTDKRPKRAGEGFDAGQGAGADRNNPFLRHDVGSGNLFDNADPFTVATATASFQNGHSNPPVPASRGVLGEYITPVLNDLWNTRPYLHDGTAHFLVDVVRPCDSRLDDCLEAGRGRNVDDKHGATSMLTPQQLNDLSAFQKTLTVDTPVGVGDRVVNAGTLTLTRASLVFGKRGKTSFAVGGTLSGSPSAVDPAAGVTFTVATPGGEEMVVFSRTLATERHGRSAVARVKESGAHVTVKLRALPGGRFRFTAQGSGSDLAALNTGNHDLTVALEMSGVSFVKNRNLVGKKRVFRIPRRRR
jgi:hypothetical protein